MSVIKVIKFNLGSLSLNSWYLIFLYRSYGQFSPWMYVQKALFPYNITKTASQMINNELHVLIPYSSIFAVKFFSLIFEFLDNVLFCILFEVHCPYNKFGEFCAEDCPCIQGNYERCDVSGICLCYSGWTGEDCSQSKGHSISTWVLVINTFLT